MYEISMDMDNGVGMDWGSRQWTGWRQTKGKKWDSCNRINKNKKKEKNLN